MNDRHPSCPQCRRWHCVVYLADGVLRCTQCECEWRLTPPDCKPQPLGESGYEN